MDKVSGHTRAGKASSRCECEEDSPKALLSRDGMKRKDAQVFRGANAAAAAGPSSPVASALLREAHVKAMSSHLSTHPKARCCDDIPVFRILCSHTN